MKVISLSKAAVFIGLFLVMVMIRVQIINASEEAAEASRFSNIRFFSVAQVQSSVPLFDIPQIEIHWSMPNASLWSVLLLFF